MVETIIFSLLVSSPSPTKRKGRYKLRISLVARHFRYLLVLSSDASEHRDPLRENCISEKLIRNVICSRIKVVNVKAII